MFVREGAIIPMAPEMNRTSTILSGPITLDMYPSLTGVSEKVLFDCETPISSTTQTTYSCRGASGGYTVDIGKSDHSYILVVHGDDAPSKVSVDGLLVPKVSGLSPFLAAKDGWFRGKGVFAGSEDLSTINIRFAGSEGASHTVVIGEGAPVSRQTPMVSRKAQVQCSVIGKQGQVIRVPVELTGSNRILGLEYRDMMGRLVAETSGSEALSIPRGFTGIGVLTIRTADFTRDVRLPAFAAK